MFILSLSINPRSLKALKFESSTKNDLEVELISRQLNQMGVLSYFDFFDHAGYCMSPNVCFSFNLLNAIG